MSVCHSATYSLPRLTDHNQIWYASTYRSSHPCKPLWIPCLPYSRFQVEKYGKFRLFPTLNGCHLDIRAKIEKSRRMSTRMSMDSIAPKYYQIRSRNEGRVGFGVTQCRPVLSLLLRQSFWRYQCRVRRRRCNGDADWMHRRRCYADADWMPMTS